MPVTFFIVVVFELFCLEIIVLNVNPERKDAAIAKVINEILFILLWFNCFRQMSKIRRYSKVFLIPMAETFLSPTDLKKIYC